MAVGGCRPCGREELENTTQLVEPLKLSALNADLTQLFLSQSLHLRDLQDLSTESWEAAAGYTAAINRLFIPIGVVTL